MSRLYAADCLEATNDPTRYDVHVAYVTPDRRWRFPAGLDPDAIAAARPMSCTEAIAQLTALELDVMVPQMFCLPGMTSYRALFDLLDIPYLGNRPEVMALTANKARARAVVAHAGVRVPDGEVLRRGDEPTLKPPAVVKPADADNSLGLALAWTPAAYDSALATAFAHGNEVLVETYVELGREVRCGIVVRDGQLICLPLEEYAVSARAPVRTVEDKLVRGADGDLRLVAKEQAKAWIVDVEDPVTESVWAAARRCHEALGCRHYSLFDFRIDPDGIPWFLEAGLYCSFARQSVISVMAQATGIATDELFDVTLHESRPL